MTFWEGLKNPSSSQTSPAGGTTTECMSQLVDPAAHIIQQAAHDVQ